MTDRLAIYNGSLLHCGERSIASLSVNEESRRILDEIWNDDGVKFCLEQGQWRFAMRTSMLSYDTAIEPSFGYRRAFAKPDDWVRTCAVCEDEYFRSPLLRYSDEARYLYADLDEIYVRYVSDDASFGNDLANWPAYFTEYVKTYFASRAAPRLPGAKDRMEKLNGRSIEGRDGVVARALLNAKNLDAGNDPTRTTPGGSWSSSRGRYQRGGRFEDGGSSSNLIG